jgi:hypothetical protein
VEPINIDDLKQFVGVPVELAIQDVQGGDQAPSVKKTVKKVQYCPDGTHIRFYLDDFYFLAVPLASRVHQSETKWTAFDIESGLHYTIKKVQVF